MTNYANENQIPAPRMNAPAVQLNPSSEIAALRARAEKAEARAERLAAERDALARAIDEVLGFVVIRGMVGEECYAALQRLHAARAAVEVHKDMSQCEGKR